jgi:hypothetical protein
MAAYIGTKLIDATPMTRLEYNNLRSWQLPADENGDDEGYLVEYVDGGQANHTDYKGYISWSPKDIFERSYRPVGGMTFGLALELLKKGARIARHGWNGKGMFVYLVPADSYPAKTEVAKNFFGESVPYNAYMAIKNVNDTVSTWVPSVNDCLSEDWIVLT